MEVSFECFIHTFKWKLGKLIEDDVQHWNWKLLVSAVQLGRFPMSAGVSPSVPTLNWPRALNWVSERDEPGEM